MKYISSIFLLFFVLIFYSCDDAGISSVNTGSITVNNLKPINQNIEGIYELWASVESAADHGENAYKSLGRFVVNSQSQLTDTAGSPFKPNLNKISNINRIEDIIITIQPPGYNDTIPSNIKILGGAKRVTGSQLVFNLTMNYIDILPVSVQIPSSLAEFILASPSAGIASAQYKRGIWFTKDTNGNSSGLTLPVLPDTAEWVYQAWVIDNSNTNYIYNIGRFSSPNNSDDYQQCRQSGGLDWQKPGNDWLISNCPGGIPDIINLENNYKILITLEPKYEQGTALNIPFYLEIFSVNIASLPFGSIQSAANIFNSNLPSAQVIISSN
jgi:hypothetical protein